MTIQSNDPQKLQPKSRPSDFVLAFAGMCVLCGCIAMTPLLRFMSQRISGQLGMHVYPNAEWIVEKQIGYGSGRAGEFVTVYWTNAPFESVTEHYAEYFSLVPDRGSLWLEAYSHPVTISIFEKSEETSKICADPRPDCVQLLRYLWHAAAATQNFGSIPMGATVIIYSYPVDHLI